MKFIFMLLILFVLTDPVLAQPVNSTSECLQMYGNYLNKYGNSKSIPDEAMLNFIGRCLPDNFIDSNQQQNLRLLRNIDNSENTTTIKI